LEISSINGKINMIAVSYRKSDKLYGVALELLPEKGESNE